MPRTLIVVLGLLLVAGAAYGIDLVTSRGDVPRGTTVAGTDVGGARPADAESTLRAALQARTSAPLRLTAGDVDTTLDPRTAGLGIDWPATLAEAGAQPLNPWTRITSFFSARDLSIVTSTDRTALDAAVQRLQARTDRKAVEGAVRFDGATPVAVAPVDGQALRTDVAAQTLADRWFSGEKIELPVDATRVAVSQQAVDSAFALATSAVSAPLIVTGQGDARARINPDQIAARLTFAAEGDGLRPALDVAAMTETLRPQLADTESKGRDAQVRLGGDRPEVVPSVDGRVVDWARTLTSDPLRLVTGDQRTVKAVYATTPAEFTTAQANALGIKEVIGEFTTGGFAYASGVNIRLAAQEIQGALVRPGTVFSLNGYTGERGSAQGYVESGIIIDGRPGTGVGGGISQLATTLYNAGYFAGLQDVEHREHSYYISRYPEAREATVYEGAIDVKFRAPAKTGILIQTIGTASNITVRIWGTKTVDVASITGDRSSFTSPRTVTVPAGEKCAPSSGAQGFTVSNTRVIRAAGSGPEISRSTHTVRYDPVPIVRCG
ncbi:MAG: VanW family protein [Mycobacteriaceae bacterium]